MGKDPAFLFYPGDWLAGTMGFSLEEQGAYLTLLIYQFNQGPFTKDDAQKILGDRFGQVWPHILNKFELDKRGKMYNVRLQNEIEKRLKHSEKQRNNVKKRWNKSGNTTVLPLENENENRNIDNTIGVEELTVSDLNFIKFWNLYGKKVGKTRVEKKFLSLPTKTQNEILKSLPAYIEATPEKQYRKNPLTYLNGKAWEDEIIINQNGNGKQQSKHSRTIINLANRPGTEHY